MPGTVKQKQRDGFEGNYIREQISKAVDHGVDARLGCDGGGEFQ
ncbi:MAG: hypothetical protein WCF26_19780 [Candidatus Sulfotelmatobacter sp.]